MQGKAKAIEMLQEDHRLIEQVLGSLENFLERPPDDSDARLSVRDFANFLENFADGYHHGKEEKFLFVRMNAYGFAREFGTMSAMIAGHEEARFHSKILAAVGRGSGPLTQEEWKRVRTHGLTCIPLLRWDIQREENILYPCAEEVLSGTVMEDLAAQFNEFESLHVGTKRRFQALAKSLADRYPSSRSVLGSRHLDERLVLFKQNVATEDVVANAGSPARDSTIFLRSRVGRF